MAMAIVRFDMRTPGLDPAQTREQYAAALEMAAWADEKGFDIGLRGINGMNSAIMKEDHDMPLDIENYTNTLW